MSDANGDRPPAPATYVGSIAERIAWSCALFEHPNDSLVLTKLWSKGDWKTGRNCRPSIETLSELTNLSEATVYRSLVRLKKGRWIVGRRRPHRPTLYDINVDQLATTPIGANIHIDLAPESTRKNENWEGGSTRKNENWPGESTRKFANSQLAPVTSDLYVQEISRSQDLSGSPAIVPSQAPPLRVGPWKPDDAATTDDERQAMDARESATRAGNLRADGGADSSAAGDAVAGHGGDHPTASGAGLPLQQAADCPGPGRPDQPGAPVGPTQQDLPPMMGLVEPAPRPVIGGQLAAAWDDFLKRKSG